MNHMSTAEVLELLGSVQQELKRRFSLPQAPAPRSVTAAAPAAVVTAPAAVVNVPGGVTFNGRRNETVSIVRVVNDPLEMTLLQNASTQQYFYSVCGQVKRCSCAYVILPDSKFADEDFAKRPEIDARSLYVHGLNGKDSQRDNHAHIRSILRSAKVDADRIKVIRTYAFITFPSHQSAAAAQRFLWSKGFYVSFNRIQDRHNKSNNDDDENNNNEDDNDDDNDSENANGQHSASSVDVTKE